MKSECDDAADRRLSTFNDRKYLVFLIIFGIFALFFVLGGRSLENMDSVRFAEISREILEFNDWIFNQIWMKRGSAI